MAITQTSKRLFVNTMGSAAATERIRTTSRGTKSRFTLDIKSEPVGVLVDPVALGKGVADAIANAIREQVRAIRVPAAVDTLLKRGYAENALKRGARWAKRRYSGGRTGTKAPNTRPGGYLFNDSGRFAEGIVARATSNGEFTINVPANRLDPSTFTPAAFDTMIQKLFELVPALGDPAKLGDIATVKAAIAEATSEVLTKATDSGIAALKDAIEETADRVESLVETVNDETAP